MLRSFLYLPSGATAEEVPKKIPNQKIHEQKKWNKLNSMVENHQICQCFENNKFFLNKIIEWISNHICKNYGNARFQENISTIRKVQKSFWK